MYPRAGEHRGATSRLSLDNQSAALRRTVYISARY